MSIRRRREKPLPSDYGRLPARVVLAIEEGADVVPACSEYVEQWATTKRRRALIVELVRRVDSHLFTSEAEQMGLLEEAEQAYMDCICGRMSAGQKVYYVADVLSYWMLYDIEGE